MVFKVHPTAEVSQNAVIGEHSAIWNHAQVREGAIIGEHCNIGKNVYIDSHVKLGNRVKVQNNVSIYSGVTIEDDVFLGPSMVFTNDLYPRAFIWDESRKETTHVKQGASIGANATIVCGKRIIGKYALVAAGSVVTKNVPDYGLVVGNPAKLVGFVCTCAHKLTWVQEQARDILMECPACHAHIPIPKQDYSLLSKEYQEKLIKKTCETQ